MMQLELPKPATQYTPAEIEDLRLLALGGGYMAGAGPAEGNYAPNVLAAICLRLLQSVPLPPLAGASDVPHVSHHATGNRYFNKCVRDLTVHDVGLLALRTSALANLETLARELVVELHKFDGCGCANDPRGPNHVAKDRKGGRRGVPLGTLLDNPTSDGKRDRVISDLTSEEIGSLDYDGLLCFARAMRGVNHMKDLELARVRRSHWHAMNNWVSVKMTEADRELRLAERRNSGEPVAATEAES